jgi:hypothetical protein
MGTKLIDQYSLLHFSTGIIARFLHVPFVYWFIFHIIFEYVENLPEIAMQIDKIKWWPGGKKSSDTFINSVGDQFFAMLGWYVADKLQIILN